MRVLRFTSRTSLLDAVETRLHVINEYILITTSNIIVSRRLKYEPRHETPVFGVFNQVRLKPACSASGAS